MRRVPPTSATPRVAIARTAPPPAIHLADGTNRGRGAAARHATPTAAAENATTTANATTHPRLSSGNVSRSGTAVMTPTIAGRNGRLQRPGRPAVQAKTTAMAARPPTLILMRQSAPTIAPITAPLSRGRTDPKVDAAARLRSQRAVLPYALIASVLTT